MGLVLNEEQIAVHKNLWGSSTITVDAQDWLQVRYGDVSNPTVELQEQCPAGKQWTVIVQVSIREANA